jgi:hypothetical protein
VAEPLIDPNRVVEITLDCLDESDSPVIVQGIVNDYAFDPVKIVEHRDEVAQMLRNLPLEFRPTSVGGGGGWSFLNACQDANDEQWTGLHQTMEHLFVLGIAMGLAEWCGPKDIWAAFPGGVPYVAVKV